MNHLYHRQRSYYLLAIAILFMVMVGVAYYFVVYLHLPNADSDFFPFWAGGHVVSHGGNPYDPLEWSRIHLDEHSNVLEDPTYVYPLPTALVFVPLGLLPLAEGGFVWLLISQLLILTSILIWLPYGDNWKLGPFVLLGVILFRPAIVTILNGQISSLLTVLISAAICCWLRRRWFLGGLIAGLLVLKPPICLFLGAAIIWLAIRRQWGGLWGIAGTIGSLLGVSGWLQPTWPLEWLQIGVFKIAETWGYAYAPTIWGATLLLTHAWNGWKILAGAISSICTLAGLWIVLRASPQKQPLLLAGVILPASLVATPYLWNYDQLMLLTPILIILGLLHKAKVAFLWRAFLFIGVDLVAIGLLVHASQLGHDAWSVLLPCSVMVVFGIAWQLNQQRPRALAIAHVVPHDGTA